MVAKTFQGLEDVLADEIKALGGENIEVGRRMVSFEGDKELLYRTNFCCRTALRVLKPFYKFAATDPDSLYEMAKEFDWSSIMTEHSTFSIDSVVNSEDFHHSRYVTYRIKDAIVDFFTDRLGEGHRPSVRLNDADVIINVHISDNRITLSLDSSGESLHKRGYRVAQTEAPISEILAAGILLKAKWNGQCDLIDPMCGSGTFLIEAALIAANIYPGVFRKEYTFQKWNDYDADLFNTIYNDDSAEREFEHKIYGADISPRAIEIARRNIESAKMEKYINLEVKPMSAWTEAPSDNGIIVTNPPYGQRISAPNMEALYNTIGERLKNVFVGWTAWIIAYSDEHFAAIGMTPSSKLSVLNGGLECQLREYQVFAGSKRDFVMAGGRLKGDADKENVHARAERKSDREWLRDARDKGFGGKGEHREHNDRRDRRERGYLPERRERRERGEWADRRDRRERGERPERRDRRNRDDSHQPLRRDDRTFEHDNETPQQRTDITSRKDILSGKIGRQPSIPPTGDEPQHHVRMRSRGWKKAAKDDNNDDNNGGQQ